MVSSLSTGNACKADPNFPQGHAESALLDIPLGNIPTHIAMRPMLCALRHIFSRPLDKVHEPIPVTYRSSSRTLD
jgi:hypothetical protein